MLLALRGSCPCSELQLYTFLEGEEGKYCFGAELRPMHFVSSKLFGSVPSCLAQVLPCSPGDLGSSILRRAEPPVDPEKCVRAANANTTEKTGSKGLRFIFLEGLRSHRSSRGNRLMGPCLCGWAAKNELPNCEQTFGLVLQVRWDLSRLLHGGL